MAVLSPMHDRGNPANRMQLALKSELLPAIILSIFGVGLPPATGGVVFGRKITERKINAPRVWPRMHTDLHGDSRVCFSLGSFFPTRLVARWFWRLSQVGETRFKIRFGVIVVGRRVAAEVGPLKPVGSDRGCCSVVIGVSPELVEATLGRRGVGRGCGGRGHVWLAKYPGPEVLRESLDVVEPSHPANPFERRPSQTAANNRSSAARRSPRCSGFSIAG